MTYSSLFYHILLSLMVVISNSEELAQLFYKVHLSLRAVQSSILHKWCSRAKRKSTPSKTLGVFDGVDLKTFDFIMIAGDHDKIKVKYAWVIHYYAFVGVPNCETNHHRQKISECNLGHQQTR